ncbi:hypothetical protein [Cupriavidus sp. YAF13]|uniref:hypothetical protein n=1 Tax=Cupriavidus sp. YAF13 TaxID=3233075 RepID=UPI003F8F3184
MKIEACRAMVERAKSDQELAELIAKMLHEADAAKAMLRRAGYGVTGMGLLATLHEVLDG